MGRHVDVDDLVTSGHIAERLGIAHAETVSNWVVRYPDFPAPVWKADRIRLWLWSEVRAWAATTDRLPPGA